MKELKLFLSQPHNTRILLITSLIYAFVLPVVDIFVAAYIMRNSSEAGRVVLYQLMVYSGIPITFWLNGFLLKWIKPNYLYSFGMLLSGFSMLIMISLPELHIQGIAVAGLVMGMSFGFFWSNRDYLVIVSTTDENRNYYYGVETFFNTLTFVVVPVIVGLFISNAINYSWIGNINKAYEFVIYVVMFLAIIASLIICRGDYEKPASSKFVYLRFEPVWYKMLLVAWGKGLVQGFIVTAVSAVLLFMWFGVWAFIPWGIIWALSMYFAFQVEKVKKDNDVQTYKEIVAFSEGKLLDDIHKQREIGKRPYQKILLVIGTALTTFVVCVLIGFLMHILLN